MSIAYSLTYSFVLPEFPLREGTQVPVSSALDSYKVLQDPPRPLPGTR